MPIINGVEVEGCEFQKECIEYKDISYLKDMPICAIFSMSVACHDKVNKCKYYGLYKQLQRMKAENETLKSQLDFEVQKKEVLEAENEKLKQILNTFEVVKIIKKTVKKAEEE